MIYTPNRMPLPLKSERSAKENNSFTQNWQGIGPDQGTSNSSKSKNYVLNSKPNLRLSFVSSADNSTVINRSDHVRHSCFLGNTLAFQNSVREDQESRMPKTAQQVQELPFPLANLTNSCKFSQGAMTSNLEDERRKSESIHVNRHSGFYKGNDEQGAKCSKVKEVEATQDDSWLRNAIGELTRRVGSNEEEIRRLKERNQRQERKQEGEVKQLKGKLLEIAKFNSKLLQESERKFEEHEQILNDVKLRIFNFNAADHTKKAALLESKLHELYEGFRIREDHHEQKLLLNISNLELKLKELVNEDISKMKATLSEDRQQYDALHNQLSKLEAEFVKKLKKQSEALKKGSKRSSTALTIESKELVVVLDNEVSKERSMNLFSSPHHAKRNLVYQTPKKIHVDTPRREVAIDEPTHEFVITQQTYYIDTQGFLLDENRYYLLDSNNQQIYLDGELLACLKEHGMVTSLST